MIYFSNGIALNFHNKATRNRIKIGAKKAEHVLFAYTAALYTLPNYKSFIAGCVALHDKIHSPAFFIITSEHHIKHSIHHSATKASCNKSPQKILHVYLFSYLGN